MAKEKKKKVSKRKKLKSLNGLGDLPIEEQLEQALSEYEDTLEPVELKDNNTIFLLPDVPAYGYSKTNVILAYMLFPGEGKDKIKREAFLKSFRRQSYCDNLLADEWTDFFGNTSENNWPKEITKEDVELLAFNQRPEDVQIMSKNETPFRYGYLMARSLEFMYCLLEAKDHKKFRYEGRINPGLLPYYVPLDVYDPEYEKQVAIETKNRRENKKLLEAKKKAQLELQEQKKGRKLKKNEVERALSKIRLTEDEQRSEVYTSPLRELLTQTPPRFPKAFRQLRGKYRNVAHLWAAYFEVNGEPFFDVYGQRQYPRGLKKINSNDLFTFLARAEEIRKISEERGAFDAVHQTDVPANPYQFVPLTDVNLLSESRYQKHFGGFLEEEVIRAMGQENFFGGKEFWELCDLWDSNMPLRSYAQTVGDFQTYLDEKKVNDNFAKRIRLKNHFRVRFSNSQRNFLNQAREEYKKVNGSYAEDVRNFKNQKVEKWMDRKSQSTSASD